MAQILVRDLDEKPVRQLKTRARLCGRSLQSEVKELLKRGAVEFTHEQAREESRKWHRQLAGQIVGDSTDLIRSDRDR